jgi:hypothetical protein
MQHTGNYQIHKNVNNVNVHCMYEFRFKLYTLYNLDESQASRV